jgi:hypothetical protein
MTAFRKSPEMTIVLSLAILFALSLCLVVFGQYKRPVLGFLRFLMFDRL